MKKAKTVRSVMTATPVILPADATVDEAARCMSENNIGDVLVNQGTELCGMVTDRDIVLRVVAEGADPRSTRLGDICSRDLYCVDADDPVDKAVELIREKAVRRVPVMDNGRPAGVVSIGDLALELDRKSALADVSAAPANH